MTWLIYFTLCLPSPPAFFSQSTRLCFSSIPPSYPATHRKQKLAVNTAKHLRHVPYEAALQQLRLFSLNHRRIHGDLITMFRIASSLLDYTTESIFTHPTCSGLLNYPYKFYQKSCYIRSRQHAFNVRIVPINLTHRGWNPSRHLWAQTGGLCSQICPT